MSPAFAASGGVAARALGPSSATRPDSVSGPRELLMTTEYPFAMASRASWLPMCPAPIKPRVFMVDFRNVFEFVGTPRRGLTTFAKATVVRRSFSGGGSPRPTSKPRTLRRAFRFRLRKQRFEESQAAWREVYGTAVRSSRGPSLFVDVPEQFSAEGAREVRTPLAPVEAGATQRSSRARERCDFNPE